jgi:hypothetical protein
VSSNWVDMHLDVLASSPQQINEIENALKNPLCRVDCRLCSVGWNGAEGRCRGCQGDCHLQSHPQPQFYEPGGQQSPPLSEFVEEQVPGACSEPCELGLSGLPECGELGLEFGSLWDEWLEGLRKAVNWLTAQSESLAKPHGSPFQGPPR